MRRFLSGMQAKAAVTYAYPTSQLSSKTANDWTVEGDFMRSLKKLTRFIAGAALALLMATAVTGCEASDEFEYMKSERQMMRHGDYGPGMSDADRQKLQESYASKQLSKVTPTAGGAAP